MFGVNSTSAPVTSAGLIDSRLLGFFLVFNLLICSEILSLFGIAGNVVNIIVFSKQGYKDSVNITLAALAVSNIGALVGQQMFDIMVNPWFLNAHLPFNVTEVLRLISFYPHSYFIRVGGFITAFASFERCLCVVAPLRVKRIITPGVALVVNVTIFIVTILHVFPAMYTTYFDWKFSARQNRTVLGVTLRSTASSVFAVSYFITDLSVPYFTFLVLIACTSVTSVKLIDKASWRKAVSGSDVSKKERKVVRMLSVVSVVFIVCLIPQSTILTAVALVQGLKVDGAYFDVAMLCYSIAYLAETVNTSVNVVVYYKMSTRYRETLMR
ncbi:unnamed protein product, partial [Lymnaea stagnalis]